MTTFYSEHYSGRIGASGHFTTLLAPDPILRSGNSGEGSIGGRLRQKAARFLVPSGTDMGSGDIIRVLDLVSSACVWHVFVTLDADFGATTTFDIGWYKKGDANDGAVIDADLHASAVDWAGAIGPTTSAAASAPVDYFCESGVLNQNDRGRPLWKLADIGAATYTQDPFETWTLAFTTTQDISAAAADVSVLCEVIYTGGSGGGD